METDHHPAHLTAQTMSSISGMIVEGVGEDVFADLLGSMGFFQPVVAALVGLIPNCAASVLGAIAGVKEVEPFA